MSALSRDDVAHVARLARLELSDAELDRYTDQLRAVLEHARDLEAFDLASTPPTAHPFAAAALLRDDTVVECLDRDTSGLSGDVGNGGAAGGNAFL